MVEGIGKNVGQVIGCLGLSCLIFVPLGLWKLVEVVIWLVRHITITVG